MTMAFGVYFKVRECVITLTLMRGLPSKNTSQNKEIYMKWTRSSIRAGIRSVALTGLYMQECVTVLETYWCLVKNHFKEIVQTSNAYSINVPLYVHYLLATLM